MNPGGKHTQCLADGSRQIKHNYLVASHHLRDMEEGKVTRG
jgi:hypothetical protein